MSSTTDFRSQVVDVLSGAFRQSHINTDEGWHGRLNAETQNIALVLAYGEDEDDSTDGDEGGEVQDK